MNFRQLDLNLLRVLVAIHRTGSVTEAGRQLALSQPATSNALARLRAFFGDELFVRSPRGLHPTRTAQRIVPAVAAHLQGLETALSATESFDPVSGAVHWRLSLSDLGEIVFLPSLAQALREESPGSRISNLAVTVAQVSAALEAHDVDLAIGILQPNHVGIASEALFREDYVGITAAGWLPAVGRPAQRLNVAQLGAASIAVAAPTATSHVSVEMMLTQLKLNDRAVLHTRHYGALPEIVSRTDLVAIVPLTYALAALRRHELRVWQLPHLGPPFEVRMVWHRSAEDDPRHRWLRDLVRRLFQKQVGFEAVAAARTAATADSAKTPAP